MFVKAFTPANFHFVYASEIAYNDTSRSLGRTRAGCTSVAELDDQPEVTQ